MIVCKYIYIYKYCVYIIFIYMCVCVCVSCFPCIFCLFCSQISRVWSEIPMMNFEGALARKPMVFGFFGPQNMLKKHTSSRCSECGKTGLITTKNRLLWRWCVPMVTECFVNGFCYLLPCVFVKCFSDWHHHLEHISRAIQFLSRVPRSYDAVVKPKVWMTLSPAVEHKSCLT